MYTLTKDKVNNFFSIKSLGMHKKKDFTLPTVKLFMLLKSKIRTFSPRKTLLKI